jgi:hypothetical protein
LSSGSNRSPLKWVSNSGTEKILEEKHLVLNGEVPFTIEQATKAQRGGKYIALLFL